MDGQYWKGHWTKSTNEWLLTYDFWQFLEPWHGRWYEYEIFIASCTDNIYGLENERWLLGDMIDHVGIYGSRVAEGLSAFNVGFVNCDQAALRTRLSVCPSVRLSICDTFSAMFLSSYHHEIAKKGPGHRGQNRFYPNLAVSGL